MRKDDAIGRFPDRNLADVTHAQFALALAEGVERQVAQANRMGGRKQLQIAVKLALQVGVEWAHAEGRGQLDDPHRTGRGDQRQIELVDGSGAVTCAHLLRARLDGHQPSIDCAARATRDLDPLAAQSLE